MEYLIYSLFAIIILGVVAIFLPDNACNHVWIEQMAEEKYKIPGCPDIINVKIIYRCTECDKISFNKPHNEK